MNLQKRNEIVQLIVRDSNHQPNESGRFKVLMDWRAKLAKEPHLLQLYQIDEIVREVRSNLTDIQPHRSSGSPAQRSAATSAVPV